MEQGLQLPRAIPQGDTLPPPSSLTQGSLTWQGGQRQWTWAQGELCTPTGPSERWCGRACCSWTCTRDGSQLRPCTPHSQSVPPQAGSCSKALVLDMGSHTSPSPGASIRSTEVFWEHSSIWLWPTGSSLITSSYKAQSLSITTWKLDKTIWEHGEARTFFWCWVCVIAPRYQKRPTCNPATITSRLVESLQNFFAVSSCFSSLFLLSL